MKGIKITAEEQHELLLLAKQGDKKAEERLLQSYVALIHHIIGKFFIPESSIIEKDDLLVEGSMALIKAIHDYNPARTTKFSTFAGVYIKNSLSVYFKMYVTTVKQPHSNVDINLMKEFNFEIELDENNDDSNDTEGKNLWKAIANLNEDEQFIISNYYGLMGDEKTDEQIGNDLGITKSRVFQLKKRAIKKLRIITRKY